MNALRLSDEVHAPEVVCAVIEFFCVPRSVEHERLPTKESDCSGPRHQATFRVKNYPPEGSALVNASAVCGRFPRQFNKIFARYGASSCSLGSLEAHSRVLTNARAVSMFENVPQ